jgi:hypothetical protein
VVFLCKNLSDEDENKFIMVFIRLPEASNTE